MNRLMLLLLLISTQQLTAQKMNAAYQHFGSDTSQAPYYLMFKSDSIVEFSSYPRHMSEPFRQKFIYQKSENIINIFISEDEEFLGYSADETISLRIQGNTLISDKTEDIYLLEPRHPTLTYRINGKDFEIKTPKVDSYALVRKSARSNRKLKRLIKSLNPDDISEMKTMHGYEAYRKFGEKYVYGIILINYPEQNH